MQATNHSYIKLIEELTKQGVLRTPAVIDAFKDIDRADFLLTIDKAQSMLNEPISIGYGQTISQPLTVAFMLELLLPQPGDKILDIGCGSGWTVALLSHLAGENGRIAGLEIVSELVNFSRENVSKYNYIESGRAEIFQADGKEGLSEFAPFDKILVSAAASFVPPELLKQLAIGGRLVIPVGGSWGGQDILQIKKLGENKFKTKKHPGFIFVPLV